MAAAMRGNRGAVRTRPTTARRISSALLMIRTESVTFVEEDISSSGRPGGLDVRGQAVHLEVVGQLDQRDVALRTVSQACQVVLRTRRASNRRRLLHSVISAV